MTLDQREKNQINQIISDLREQIDNLLSRLDRVEGQLRELRNREV
jgi:prefoldin subunit 5